MKTIYGTPLSETAMQNLARFKAMAQARRDQNEAVERREATLERNGVKVYSAEERAAYAAQHGL